MSGRLERFARAVAAAVARRRGRALVLWGLAVALSAGLAVGRLQLATSNLDLVDPTLPEVAAFRGLAEEFGTPNVLVVVLEGEDPAAVEAAVHRLGPELRAVAGVRSVVDRLPFDAESLQWLDVPATLGSDDGTLRLVLVQPADPDSRAETIAPLVDGVDGVLASAGLERQGIHAGLTGLPRYALDDREIVSRDVSRLSVVSLVLVAALFVFAFAAVRRPLAVVATLVAAVTVTLGVASVVPGRLTLLSAFFGSILFGLGIDFGIHVVDRLEELLAEGASEADALPQAMGSVFPALATGAATTASAFFGMASSGFRGFAELGAIAGTGVLICLLATLTLLPALLVRRVAGEGRVPSRRLGRVLARLSGRPAALVTALAALALALGGPPGFDSDYTHLQPAGSATVRLDREVVERTPYSSQFAAFVVDSKEEVRDLTLRLLDEPEVESVRSILDLDRLAMAPTDDPEQLAALRRAFESPDGRFAVYAYPAHDLWDPARQEDFVERMRALDPGVTGMPILGSFMIERSHRALRRAGWTAVLALVFWVGLDLRRPLLVVLACLPALLGALVTLGAMSRLGLAFNPLNVMALPAALGIAVDDGVHLVHRFLREGGDRVRTLAGTGRSVVLTSATSIAAFGCLAATEHRGLASLAIVLCLAVAVALALSVFLLPELLAMTASRIVPRPPSAIRMVPVLALLVSVTWIVPAQAVGEPPVGPEARGAEAWARRATDLGVDPVAVDEAVAAWEEALAADPEDLALRWRLLEALTFRGDHAEESSRRADWDRVLDLAREGLAQVERGAGVPADAPLEERITAVRWAPEAAAAHFWVAAAWGLWGTAHGNLASAGRDVAGHMRDHALAAIALDESYADAGGLRLLGRLETVAPKVPFVSGWIDRWDGIDRLERACAVSRRDPRNPLFLAQALLAWAPERRCEALSLLEGLAGRRPAARRRVEEAVLEEARRTLAELPHGVCSEETAP
ncbi:MAG: MMPL family transporter [Thermoanaerobaculia bacterium]